MGRFNDVQTRRTIGALLIAMVVLQLWRTRQPGDLASRLPHAKGFAILMGIAAGFVTMTANAAGPLMVIYLLALGLPKMALVGTGAWFFLLVNAFKVPFYFHLDLITADSLKLDALLCIAVVPGALLGPIILKRINQSSFEIIVLVFTIVAALRLVM